VGVSLIPAFGTLYQRLTLPESDRFKEAQQKQAANAMELQHANESAEVDAKKAELHDTQAADTTEVVVEKPAHFRGTCTCMVELPLR
jgi:PHS family inorganic phosphate transporter-like MFS transporter